MRTYDLGHVSDAVLLRDLAALASQDRNTTAALLAHIAEVDARRLYVPAAYPSMFLYSVHELRLSESAAFRRIQAARTAREYPSIFPALAEGRLNISAVIMLAQHLTPETADELLAAASLKTKAEIQELLAQRFPRADIPGRVRRIPSSSSPLQPTDQLALERVETPTPTDQLAPERVEIPAPTDQLALERVEIPIPTGQLALERVEIRTRRPTVTPLAPERFAV